MSAVAAERLGPAARDNSMKPTRTAACAHPCSALHAEDAEPVLVEAQRRWAARSLGERLQVVRRARHWMAGNSLLFAEAISPELHRSQSDTLVTEVLPVLDAMRFLERSARKLLAPHVLGGRGRPLLLTGVRAEVQRVPLGHVLVIGPANYPLFIPAVQALQALAAGNAVTWKPGAGGQPVALMVKHALRQAGLPRGVLRITDESVEAAQDALAQRPDKVVFTGSLHSGKRVLSALAETATPAVMELSGADAVIVLPSADLALVAKAVAFGLRLNGAEVCMSPRRLFATAETMRQLRPLLSAELAQVRPISIRQRTEETLRRLTSAAEAQGARLLGTVDRNAQRPLVVDLVSIDMEIARTDIFAPVLSLIEARSVLHLPEMVNNCPYGLTAAVFGDVREARSVGGQLRVGTVLINDLIAPTVDPRVPFGGRGASGFGLTRGAEGLLEMTAVKTVLVRHKGIATHYGGVDVRDISFFTQLIAALHAGSPMDRIRALRALAGAARKRT